MSRTSRRMDGGDGFSSHVLRPPDSVEWMMECERANNGRQGGTTGQAQGKEIQTAGLGSTKGCVKVGR
jgi:hypothetical protein